MAKSGWLVRCAGDLPADDGWLTERERGVLAALRSEPRRASWRLGRWAAKAAVSAWSGVEPALIEVVNAPSGAPEAVIDGAASPLGLSLSHRGGRALAVVGEPGLALGCDLELVEPRSEAFARTWLAPAEREALGSADEAERAELANLLWTAKEAAAKARLEGLRLDVGRAVVEVDGEGEGGWRPLRVRWEGERGLVRGWWRREPGWVLALVSEPPTAIPVSL